MHLDQGEVTTLFFITLGLMAATAIMLGKLMFALTKNHDAHQSQLKNLRLEHENAILLAQVKMKDQTFREIAQEVHDNILQTLRVSNLALRNVNVADETAMEKIRFSIGEQDKVTRDLNDLSRSLNADWIKGQGLINALEKEVEKLRLTGMFTVETSFSQGRKIMDADRELFIFRIVQEVFNNIIKHSRATQIIFSILYQPGHICLTITDDGNGFHYSASENNTEGSGLYNMASRAELLGGQLSVDTAPGKGTAVKLEVPYEMHPTP